MVMITDAVFSKCDVVSCHQSLYMRNQFYMNVLRWDAIKRLFDAHMPLVSAERWSHHVHLSMLTPR